MNWDDDESTATADRLVAAAADGEDQAVEAALRPKDLAEFVGQERVREQLDLVLKAARQRGATADHVLLSGAPGLGKTTLSMIIAAEMGAPIRITSGPAIQHAGDLAAILSSLQEGEVLFLDEIHRMSRPAEEMLYMAMEDFRVDVIVGKGPGATAIPLELPPFTLVGATTRAGLLPPPLRDRFGFTGHMEFYAPAELERVVHRSAGLLDVDDRRRAAPRRSPAAPAAPRGSPTGCCAGSATTPRSRRTAASPGRSPQRALQVYEVDAARSRPARPRGARRAVASCSAAGRSDCRHWRWRWGRSARRWRRSPSRSWYGRDCWRALPVAGSPLPAAWAHLGLVPPHARCRAPRTARAVRPLTARGLVARRNRECNAGRCSEGGDSLRLRRCRSLSVGANTRTPHP